MLDEHRLTRIALKDEKTVFIDISAFIKKKTVDKAPLKELSARGIGISVSVKR